MLPSRESSEYQGKKINKQEDTVNDKTKVLFVGLDSIEPELVLQMCEAGEMPVLQSLRQKGAWSVTQTLRGFGDGVMWPCVFTVCDVSPYGTN